MSFLPTLTAVGNNDVNDQLKIDDLDKLIQIDNSIVEAQTAAGSGTRAMLKLYYQSTTNHKMTITTVL